MKVNDKILISPDLTRLKNWTEGTVIKVEYVFNGTVITAETKDKKVFSSRSEMFKNDISENKIVKTLVSILDAI